MAILVDPKELNCIFEEIKQNEKLLKDEYNSYLHPNYGLDLIGMTFGDLKICAYGEKRDNSGKRLYTCKCICGKTLYVSRSALINGHTRRCSTCRDNYLKNDNNRNSCIPDSEFIGKTFNKLTVLRKSDKKDKQGKTLYECSCSCGSDKLVLAKKFNIYNGYVKSCGCILSDTRAKKKLEFEQSLIGKQFGLLTVIKRIEDSNNTSHNSRWLCQCDCGIKIIKFKSELDIKDRRYPLSCGCASPKKFYPNSEIERRLSKLYDTVKSRCYNPNGRKADNYCKRGIDICTEWLMNKRKFVEWALDNGYRPGLTLERVDVNKGYSPDNCAWITIQEQQYNKQNTIKLADGIPFRLFCKDNNFHYDRIRRNVANYTEYTTEELFNIVANDPYFKAI